MFGHNRRPRVWPGLLVAVWLCGSAGAQESAPASQAVLRPPLPVWPADQETITERRPVFRFSGRVGARRYRLELDRTPKFEKPVCLEQSKVVDDRTLEPGVTIECEGEPLADGQYYWRVFAADEAGNWTPPANYRTFRVADVDPDAVAPPKEPIHPSLLFTAAELPELRARINKSEHLTRGWQYLYNAAVSMIEASSPDERYARLGEGQHGYYSAAALWYQRHLEAMAFVACVSGEPRFARKAVDMLMTICGYQRWLGPLFDDPKYFDPPWHAALETAMATHAVATAYDLLYEHLTDEQRRLVRQAIVEKGVRPLISDWVDPVGSSRIPRHQLPTGNWGMVCGGGAGVGALALLGEQPEAAAWVRLVTTRTRAWLHDRGGDYCLDNPYPGGRARPAPILGPSEPNFGADGGYKESITYMNYAVRYVCSFGDALRRTTGVNVFSDIPANLLEPVAWNVLAWPATGQVASGMFDFGDCGPQPAFEELYAALIRNTRNPRASWLYRRIVPVPLLPRSLVWHDDGVVEQPPDLAVPMRVFHDLGQVVCRSGWSPDTPAAAIKFYQNRGHLDVGTFCLFGGGQPTITDSGVTNYGHEVYKSYSSQSAAHNVVLVDGRSQARVNGRMLAAVATSCMSAVSGELSGAYPAALESWTRDLVMLPGRRALVLDSLYGRGPHQYDLLLHPFPPCEIRPPATLWIGDKQAPTVVHVLSDRPLSAKKRDGYYENQPRQYVAVASDGPAEQQSFLTFCTWPARSGMASDRPKLEPAGQGRWAFDSQEKGTRLTVRVGGSDSDRLRADGRIVVVRETGQRRQCRQVLLLAGTRLAVDGRELFRSTVQLSAAIEYGVPLRAHIWSQAPAQVTIAADPQIRDVLLNGQPVTVRWQDSSLTLEVPAGETQLMGSDFPRPPDRPAPLVFDDLAAVASEAGAPAFRSGVTAVSSTSLEDGLLAIDGNPNTAWSSLPGVPMPQWLEIRLPRAERMGMITVDPGQVCTGVIEAANDRGSSWRRLGGFRTRSDTTASTVLFPPADITKIRVTIESVSAPGGVAEISTLRWGPGVDVAGITGAAPASAPASSPASTPAAHIRAETRPGGE